MIPGLVFMSALLPLVSDKNARRTKGRVGSTGCSRERTKSSSNEETRRVERIEHKLGNNIALPTPSLHLILLSHTLSLKDAAKCRI